MENKTYFTLAEKDHYRVDDYGNLFMTSGDGTELKVGKKRAHLHPIIIDNPGAVLQLTWDEFKDIEYVSDLVLFKGKELTTEQQNAKVVKQAVDSVPSKPLSREATINRAVALKAAIEEETNGMLEAADPQVVIARARTYERYLNIG